MTIVVVRRGGATIAGDAGGRFVRTGDVIVMTASDASLRAEPEPCSTATTLRVDCAYLSDQAFWQHAGIFSDRLDAKRMLEARPGSSIQIVRVSESRNERIGSWLDELVFLSAEGLPSARFYRAQSILFSVLHAVVPDLTLIQHGERVAQRGGAHSGNAGVRMHLPYRTEARLVAELLRDDLRRRRTLDELARTVHLSPSQLNRVFVQAFGRPPIAYLTMLRVERMALLLRTTDLTVSAIAAEVGWGSADFAARQFRRSQGVSPTRYRAGLDLPALGDTPD
ncbi:helix-turn-helix domain-containing protein [Microbacterium lacticum]|uniref:helix-turn-helix domain-containing protein n=1 Tax=Microbacterium lacticum TaxID=33885 RepID=UPI0014772A8B|nr:helix-turn-helix domain-containing protein [Microbacterium lacticum]